MILQHEDSVFLRVLRLFLAVSLLKGSQEDPEVCFSVFYAQFFPDIFPVELDGPLCQIEQFWEFPGNFRDVHL